MSAPGCRSRPSGAKPCACEGWRAWLVAHLSCCLLSGMLSLSSSGCFDVLSWRGSWIRSFSSPSLCARYLCFGFVLWCMVSVPIVRVVHLTGQARLGGILSPLFPCASFPTPFPLVVACDCTLGASLGDSLLCELRCCLRRVLSLPWLWFVSSLVLRSVLRSSCWARPAGLWLLPSLFRVLSLSR